MTKAIGALASAALLFALLPGCGGNGASQSMVSNSLADDALEQAASIAADVRAMAAEDGHPQPGSPLEHSMLAHQHLTANCSDYAQALVDLIEASGLGVQARIAQTCMVPNRYDCHTLVELFEESTGRWILVDPTFGLAPRNASDGSHATLDDMRASARSGNWNAITYEFLTPEGDQYAQDGYMDYPLYFYNTFVSGADPARLTEALFNPAERVYIPLGSLPAPGHSGVYALQCADGKTASAVINGNPVTLACPALGLTWLQWQTTDVPTDGSVVLQPLRFVFNRSSP